MPSLVTGQYHHMETHAMNEYIESEDITNNACCCAFVCVCFLRFVFLFDISVDSLTQASLTLLLKIKKEDIRVSKVV